MRAKTAEGKQLKRLATVYALRYAATMGLALAKNKCERDKIISECGEARERLFAAIDRVTEIDLSP